LFAVIVWGASFIASKIALRQISPVTLIWIRFLMGLIVMTVVVVQRKELRKVPRKEFAYFSLLGFLGVTFHHWLQSSGLVTAQATTTSWIITTSPVFIVVLGWIVLGEKLGWLRFIGILLAAFGVLMVVSKGELNSLIQGDIGTFGEFLIILSAANWALFSVLSRRSLKKYPAALLMFYVMLTGWIFINIMFFRAGGHKEFSHIALPGWISLVFLGIFCSGIAYMFWYDALKSIPASQVGAFLYLEPLITMILAAIVLKESMRLPMFIGGAIIIAGVWLVTRRGDEIEVGS